MEWFMNEPSFRMTREVEQRDFVAKNNEVRFNPDWWETLMPVVQEMLLNKAFAEAKVARQAWEREMKLLVEARKNVTDHFERRHLDWFFENHLEFLED